MTPQGDVEEVLQAYVPQRKKKLMKYLAAKAGIDLSDIVNEAINRYLVDVERALRDLDENPPEPFGESP